MRYWSPKPVVIQMVVQETLFYYGKSSTPVLRVKYPDYYWMT